MKRAGLLFLFAVQSLTAESYFDMPEYSPGSGPLLQLLAGGASRRFLMDRASPSLSANVEQSELTLGLRLTAQRPAENAGSFFYRMDARLLLLSDPDRKKDVLLVPGENLRAGVSLCDHGACGLSVGKWILEDPGEKVSMPENSDLLSARTDPRRHRTGLSRRTNDA